MAVLAFHSGACPRVTKRRLMWVVFRTIKNALSSSFSVLRIRQYPHLNARYAAVVSRKCRARWRAGAAVDAVNRAVTSGLQL